MVKEYIFFGGKSFGRMRNYVCYMDIKKIFKYTHTYVQNKYIYIYICTLCIIIHIMNVYSLNI